LFLELAKISVQNIGRIHRSILYSHVGLRKHEERNVKVVFSINAILNKHLQLVSQDKPPKIKLLSA